MNDRIRATLKELPDKPGCYLMRDRAGKIIYVGKAVSLRRRVQSYFRASTLAKAPPKLRGLIHSIESLEFLTVRNEAEALLQLAGELGLRGVPHVIEGFDISHMGGTLTVASLVASVDGEPAPSLYRRFRIQTAGNDDPASMAEVITRRYSRLRDEGRPMPDLVMVDGGLAQLRSARSILEGLGLSDLQTIGLAKRVEEIVVDRPGTPSVLLPIDSPALQVLIRLRDEAHRFAITYNRTLRQKRIRESVLDEIPGIGEHRKALLLKTFGSVRRLAKADAADVAKVGGIGPELAKEILRVCRGVTES